MFNRSELKQRGKRAFMVNYWKCVLAAFIVSLLLSGTTGTNASYNVNDTDPLINGGSDVVHLGGSLLPSVFTVFFLTTLIIAIVLEFFVFNVIEAGGDNFFVKNSHGENPSIGELFALFSSGSYLNVVKIMFFRDLYTVLWSLCLIIPGVIKTYEYRMIPYILGQNPSLSKQEVFAKSKEMMTGTKWNAFVLDLSFIGWDILSLFTFGLLQIFYVSPYKEAVNAELYNYLSVPYSKETVDPDVIDASDTQNFF